MLKKIFIVLVCFTTMFCAQAFAADDDIADAKAFFDKLVAAYNSYSKNVPSYFTSDARIFRIVIKPDGTKQSVEVPRQRYFDELTKGRVGAKLVGYKNRFENVNITQSDDTFNLKAKRFAFKDKKGLDCSYEIVKTENGFKVKTEKWDTTVQSFLKEK